MTLKLTHLRRAATVYGAALALALGVTQAADAQTTLRFATLQSPQNPMLIEVNKAFDKIAEATEGRVTFQVHYGKDSGFGPKQFLTALETGLLDGALISTSAMASDHPWTGVYGLPLLLPDADLRRPIVEATKPRLEVLAEDRNIVPLAYPVHMDRWVVLYSTKDVQSLADTSGKLIRTYDANTIAIAEALGGVPTSMAKSEVYMGLEKGTIDGAITGDTSAEAMHMNEVTPYILKIDTIFLPHVLGFSADAWEEIDEADRTTIKSIFAAWEEEYWNTLAASDATDAAFDYAREHGMKVIEPSPEIRAALETVRDATAAAFVAVDDESRDVYEDVQQVIETEGM